MRSLLSRTGHHPTIQLGHALPCPSEDDGGDDDACDDDDADDDLHYKEQGLSYL